MKDDEHLVGLMEDFVRNPANMDGAIAHFLRLKANAPTFAPERRRFLRVAALAAAAAWLARADEAGAVASRAFGWSQYGKPVEEFRGKRYSGWQAYLLGQDLIYGPPLHIRQDGVANGFKEHIQVSSDGKGAIDLALPNGVPLVPPRYGYSHPYTSGIGAKIVNVFHQTREGFSYVSMLGHVKGFSKNLIQGSDDALVNETDMTFAVAISGETGTPTPHLHWQMSERHGLVHNSRGEAMKWSNWGLPGVNPHKAGIDGLPVYYDGETPLRDAITGFGIRVLMRKLAAALDEKSGDELALDKATIQALRARIDERDVAPMQDYLRHEVFTRHADGSGKPNYRHLPGSFMYSVGIQFVRQDPKVREKNGVSEAVFMLPVISPLVVDVYAGATDRKGNRVNEGIL
ncbi:MAG: hypothetical protein H6907_15110 [Hyphomicrobiales bacterium]|nr:hypothetical protein [Hyphomicrobiales bacterium]MCP5373054.1 hypothetical protein [Hyphomicrobiales bacterium]